MQYRDNTLNELGGVGTEIITLLGSGLMTCSGFRIEDCSLEKISKRSLNSFK